MTHADDPAEAYASLAVREGAVPRYLPLVIALLLTIPTGAAGLLVALVGALDSTGVGTSGILARFAVFGVVVLAAWVALVWAIVVWWREGRTHVWGLPLIVLTALTMTPLLLLLLVPAVRRAVVPQQPSGEPLAR